MFINFSKNIIEKTIFIILLITTLISLTMLSSINNNLTNTINIIKNISFINTSTQRLVKLETSNIKNDELLKNLDTIIGGFQSGNFTNTSLDIENNTFQKDINSLNNVWRDLKKEIYLTRKSEYQNTNLLNISEEHFFLADSIINSAENLVSKQASKVAKLEIVSFLILPSLLIYLLLKIFCSLKLSKLDLELTEKAYLDLHTNLPNKSKCNKLLESEHTLTTPTAVIVFDLNGLKQVNDTYGHILGDKWISNFANILRTSIPQKHFVGRYGGDEFISILYDTNASEINDIIAKIDKAINKFNSYNKQIPLSYSFGYDLSTNYTNVTLQSLLLKADINMYSNKNDFYK